MQPHLLHAKLQKVRALIREKQAGGLLISTVANFAWLTGGGDNRVRNASDVGASSLLITPDQHYFITNNIECPRVVAEELDGLGYQVRSFPWHERPPLDIVREITGRAPLLSDTGLAGTPNVDADLAPLRWQFDEEERASLRTAGQIAAASLDAVTRAIHPGMTEHEMAGLLSREVMARGALPAITLVAADDRIVRYRHPIPTGLRMEQRAMLVLGARYRGLIVCATRLVSFGEPSADLLRRHVAVTRVDRALIQATRPGKNVGDLFAEAQAAYAAAGFPNEWTLHHQGGPTGYAAREYLAKPGLPQTVLLHQAFAWNPTVTGTKSEDTILVGESGNIVLTEMAGWPMLDEDGLRRPAILVR